MMISGKCTRRPEGCNYEIQYRPNYQSLSFDQYISTHIVAEHIWNNSKIDRCSCIGITISVDAEVNNEFVPHPTKIPDLIYTRHQDPCGLLYYLIAIDIGPYGMAEDWWSSINKPLGLVL
jgi:hypothetical protein